MKSTYPTSKKVREYAVHLRRNGKQKANRSTRRIFRAEARDEVQGLS